MTQLSHTRTLRVPADRVWSTLADFGAVERFHPRVASSPLLGEQATGLGAERQCNFHDGNAIKERVVAWEEGRLLKIEIYEASMPLKRAIGTLELVPRGAETDVVFTMDYAPKFGPLGALMDRLMMRKGFCGMLMEVLEGLEEHLETGRVVNAA
jgi:uncharacterized protein YndB with AHSA1/START domain